MDLILNLLSRNKSIQMLCIFIVLDVIFGFLRSVKERKTNSTIGIDGIIRKTGMMITIATAIVIDKIANIDLIFFIPENIKNVLNLKECGITILFNSLYIIFESLSILKNMRKCEIPFPRRLNDFLEKLLTEFTSEMEDGKGSVINESKSTND